MAEKASWQQHHERLRIVSSHQLAAAATMCAEAQRMTEKASEMMTRAALARAILARRRAARTAA